MYLYWDTNSFFFFSFFLLKSFYYDGKATMSNEEFDNLKEELMWEGSSVVMLSKYFFISFLNRLGASMCRDSIMVILTFNFFCLILRCRFRWTEVSGSFNGLCVWETNFERQRVWWIEAETKGLSVSFFFYCFG